MAKIKDGSTYLGHHLAQNDYYCENETVLGRWQGKGAARLQLEGEIHAGDAAFEALRQNRHPETGERLTPRDGADRVCFYDFQCSAQKSVSIMAVTIGDVRLIEAHDRAAKLAFSELELFAATQENTVLTRSNRITGNAVAAVFRHTASRALDPQVHTHHVVANATWDEKTQSWRALTEFEMVRAIRYGGKVYQNELARECRRLGYEIEIVRDEKGRTTGFELAGVSEDLRERFSKRRADVEKGIEEFRQKHGRAPTIAETHAITVRTRSSKLEEITTPEVLAAQRAQLTPSELGRLDDLRRDAESRSKGCRELAEPPRERECLRYAAGHIFERKSVAIGHEILAEALNSGLGHIDVHSLKSSADQSALIRVGSAQWLQAPIVTERGMRLEKWAIEHVAETKDRHGPIATIRRDQMPSLSDHQFKAVSELLGSRDQVVCLRGAAGVGKSTIVKEVQSVLEGAGKPVFYCAPTGSAAETLRKDGIRSATTVSDFLQNVAIRDHERLKGAILIVDEAGLASNTQGAQILRLADERQARIIFLGDSRQHSSVEAGDFLRILERHSSLHRVEVTDIRRQQEIGFREAIQMMALGAVRAGMERMDSFGWITEGKTEYLQQAVGAFVRQVEQGTELNKILAVTPTWDENHAFTDQLRGELKRRNVLGPGEELALHESLQWTKAEKSKPEHYQPGMVVQMNSRTPGLVPGQAYSVSRVDDNGVWLCTPKGDRKLPTKDGRFDVMRVKTREVCPGDRLMVLANDRAQGLVNGEILSVKAVANGIVEAADGKRIDTRRFASFGYGYAVTSHKSQSKTVDYVIVAAERLDAKSAYVACSRGRLSCRVFTPDRENLLSKLPEGNRRAVVEVLQVTDGSRSVFLNGQTQSTLNRESRATERRTERLERQSLWRGLSDGIQTLWQRLWARAVVDEKPHDKGGPTDRSNP